MERSSISASGFRTAFVLLLVLAVSALFVAVAWPFLKPLLFAALLASLCYPLFTWILRLVRGRRSLAAILTLLILFILVAGPISAFVGVVVSQAELSAACSSSGRSALLSGQLFAVCS